MSIESIKQRISDATQGPWWQGETTKPVGSEGPFGTEIMARLGSHSEEIWVAQVNEESPGPDADLIAHAPTDLALLLAVVDAAKVLAGLASVAYTPFEVALEALEAAD